MCLSTLKKLMKKFLFVGITLLLAGNLFAQEEVKVTVHNSELIQTGHFAFVMPGSARVVELNLKGETVWSYQIPRKYIIQGAPLSRGPDIKWIEDTDTFLVVLPSVGIIEISRSKKIVWEYMTTDISHDADLLPDGSVVFVNGWDKPNDYIITRVSRNKKIISRFRASDLSIDLKDQVEDREGNTHINAITFFNDSDFMVSLRNYHAVRKYSNQKLIWEVTDALRVHDPILINNDLYFADRRRPQVADMISQSIQRHNIVTNQREIFYSVQDVGWTPLRTLELLKNNNFLITGSTKVGQISSDGDLVWEIEFLDFENQRRAQRGSNFIYKAAFVYN